MDRRRFLGTVSVAGVAAGVGAKAYASEPVSSPTAATIQSVREYLEARNSVITGARTRSLARGSSLASLFDADYDVLRATNRDLTQLHAGYASAKTTVDVVGPNDANGSFRVVEHTTLVFNNPEVDGPESTSYQAFHEIQTHTENGRQVLASISWIPESPSFVPLNQTDSEGRSALAGLDMSEPPGLDDEIERHQAEEEEVRRLLGNQETYAANTWTPSAAAFYCAQWAVSPNPAYRTYSNDCTNFVSQCVKAGGWKHKGLVRTSNNAWFYGSTQVLTSYTWAGAHNLRQFGSNSSRTMTYGAMSSVKVGDVLFFDWDKDGTMDHVQICSMRSGSGKQYMSQHSSNYLDKPLSEILAQTSVKNANKFPTKVMNP